VAVLPLSSTLLNVPKHPSYTDGAKTMGQLEVSDEREKKQNQPSEVIPVGLFNPAPEKDDPIYYHASTAADGKTVTVGPFHLTGRMLRDWAEATSSNDLDDLVSKRAIRPSTALTVNSAQFRSVLEMMENGQKPNDDLIRRIIPGDLQRVVEAKRLENK
jgi:hypothetical protein